MPFHLQTFQSSLHPTFQPFYPLTFQPFHPLTFQPLTSKFFFPLEMSNTCKNCSRNWPGGQNFFLMVEGLRKNCGRYKNSQTKYTPLAQGLNANKSIDWCLVRAGEISTIPAAAPRVKRTSESLSKLLSPATLTYTTHFFSASQSQSVSAAGCRVHPHKAQS